MQQNHREFNKKFDKCIKIHNYAPTMHNYLADQKASASLSASLVGARGYAGIELAKLLIRHPYIKLTTAFATGEFSLHEELMDERFESVKCLSISATPTEVLNDPSHVVFLATPIETSLQLAPELLKSGKTVIDLSGAFRLKKNDYQKWYKLAHPTPELIASAEYGLQPFSSRRCLGLFKKAPRLISNPGCYATAIAMALIPLLKRSLINPKHIVIDAKSGTSGAGKKAQENLLFTEVDGECLPYRVGQHQHHPEIQESIEAFSQVHIDPHFTTNLLATPRGLIAGIYAEAMTENIQDITRAFAEEYAGYSLVRHSTKISQYASLKRVVHTPYTHISYELVGRKLYVFSCIDNLLKGAASQAIENLNQLLGLPLDFSLVDQALKQVQDPKIREDFPGNEASGVFEQAQACEAQP